MQTAEQEYLANRKQARSTQESLVEQPENTEAVDVSEDTPVEDVIETEVITNEEVAPEAEEPAEEVTEAQANETETDLFYYDVDGEEVSSDQLKEWKANGLMQADYTRKTQDHAEDIKTFKVKEEAFDKKVSEFESKIVTLESMISEESLTPEALAELREFEPEQYIEYTEKMVKRKQFVDSNKSTKTESVKFDVEAERSKLWDRNPTWLDNGKQTKAFTADMDLIQTYATKNGYNNDNFATFKANEWQTLLSAAKYEALNNKNAAIEKKVRKAPAITKPRAKANNSIQSEIDVVQKRYNQYGSDKDFLLLRKLNRQLK